MSPAMRRGEGCGACADDGTPETVAECGESHTGYYLKKVLEKSLFDRPEDRLII